MKHHSVAYRTLALSLALAACLFRLPPALAEEIIWLTQDGPAAQEDASTPEDGFRQEADGAAASARPVDGMPLEDGADSPSGRDGEITWLEEGASTARDVPSEPDDGMEWLTQDAPPAVQSPAAVPEAAPRPETAAAEQDAAEQDGAAADDGMIDVTVPGSASVIINPLRSAVELDGKTYTDQIVSSEQIMVSHSEVPLVVGASVTATVPEGSSLAITGHPLEGGEADKLAYLYMEFQNLPSAGSEAGWSGGYTGAPNQLLASGDGAVLGDVLQLCAGAETPAYAAYRLFGSLSETPLDEWNSKDGLTVTVSFTFRPVEDAAAAQTGKDAGEAPDGGGSEDLEHAPEADAKAPEEGAMSSEGDGKSDGEDVQAPGEDVKSDGEDAKAPGADEQPERTGEDTVSTAAADEKADGEDGAGTVDTARAQAAGQPEDAGVEAAQDVPAGPAWDVTPAQDAPTDGVASHASTTDPDWMLPPGAG